MLNSETLEVAIGMAFLFLFISIICTAAKEWLEGIFKWRAMDLERALRTLLADPDGALTSELLGHPLLSSLFAGNYDRNQLRSSWMTPGQGSKHMRLSQRRNLPSYIPARQFATALLDFAAHGPAATSAPAADAPRPTERGAGIEQESGLLSIESLRTGVQSMSPHIQRVILSALDHSAGSVAQARLNVERWFDGTMDRASGWYKRRSQAVLFVLGFAIAATMNVDALYIMRWLTTDKTFRDVVVKQAAEITSPALSASMPPSERIHDARHVLEEVAMPIGWVEWSMATAPAASAASVATGASAASAARGVASELPLPRQLCKSQEAAGCERSRWIGNDWWMVLCGWLVTAFAVMLGAPFWFDVLNKIVVVRSTVKPHEKSPEESTQDRQVPEHKEPGGTEPVSAKT